MTTEASLSRASDTMDPSSNVLLLVVLGLVGCAYVGIWLYLCAVGGFYLRRGPCACLGIRWRAPYAGQAQRSVDEDLAGPDAGQAQRSVDEDLAGNQALEELELALVNDQDCSSPCVICLDPILPRQRCKRLPCSHAFHPDCLKPWWTQKVQRGLKTAEAMICPICRTPALTVGNARACAIGGVHARALDAAVDAGGLRFNSIAMAMQEAENAREVAANALEAAAAARLAACTARDEAQQGGPGLPVLLGRT